MSIRETSFVWVGRATRRWQPKTKGFKAGDRLFLWGEGWFNTKKSWFNGKSCGRIWKVIIFDISLQREAIECLGKRSLTENLL